MAETMHILVAGANRPLGVNIAERLCARGHSVLATRRVPDAKLDARLEAAGVEMGTLDLLDLDAVTALGGRLDAAVLTPILSVSESAAIALQAAGVSRGLVFSSNNVSVVGADPVYDRLRAGEGSVMATCPDWAILRPTMIYGYPGDGNLGKLLMFLARSPIVPLLGRGQAIQQPIHVNDLGRIAAGLVLGDWIARGGLAVGGLDRMSHRQMINLAKQISGGRGVSVSVPIGPARVLISMATKIGLPLPVSAAQLARLELDKAAVNPADVPEALRPTMSLEAGLSALAAELGLSGTR